MMMCIGIYERYFDRKIAIISTFALFLSWESIRMISQINTSEFQFLYPIIATYLITNVHKERIIKSLILVFFIGYLITVKHNIAIILAIISYFIIYKKIKEAFLFIIVISLFPLFYLIYINNLGYEIYFHLFESDHSYGSWILSSDLNAIFLAFIRSIFVFLKYNFDYYFIFLIPFIIFLSNKNSYIKFRKEILFGFLLIFFTFIQGYAAQKFGRFTFDQMTYHTRAYMVGDYAFIIFWTFGIILQNNYYLFKRYVNFIFIVWFSYSSIFFINLPWKHPNEQPSRNWQERVKNLPK